MLFTSLAFLIFFATVYALYVAARGSLRVQNVLLLVASYVFYGWWNWRYLFLLTGYTAISFLIGKGIDQAGDPRTRKSLLALSIVSSLTLLGFFKYFGFFVDSLVTLLNQFGLTVNPVMLDIVLPVGISFYTFQTLSYTIDIYRSEIHHTDNAIDFALFVSLFPQLLAGPIGRAKNLLPQIASVRRFDVNQVDAGVFLILWGTYKKIVIADNVARVADQVFNNYPQYNGLDIVLGVLAFTFQIYCDFSGYSDIARGLAKLLGLELMVNFRLPYFAANPRDFWQRWHISLSSWLRDYLYIPLGGNRNGRSRTLRNLMVTMLLGGLWHGAAWNYVIWGAYHGLILALYRVYSSVRVRRTAEQTTGYRLPLSTAASTGAMFLLTAIGWLVFRSESVAQMAYMLTHVGLASSDATSSLLRPLFFYVAPLAVVQVAQQRTGDLLILTKLVLPLRVIVYAAMLFMIFVFGVREQVEFIYFQF